MNNPDNGSDRQVRRTNRKVDNVFPTGGNAETPEDTSETYASGSAKYGLHHDIIAGVIIIIGSAFLLTRITEMPLMSAVLPISMLGALIVLAALMILRALIGGTNGRPMAPRYDIFSNRPRFFGIASSILIYTVCVSFIGFYTATAIMIPVIAWSFGYRDIKRLLLANVIFTGGLAVIFVLLMGQELPIEFFLR